MNIILDPEFHSLIPPLSSDEMDLLEKSIVTEGCRDALVLWGNILLDGHNRYEICKKHKIKFQVTAMKLPDRNAAIEWIILNQFGRRNITPFTRAELALKLEPIIKAKAKAEQTRKPINSVPQKSAEQKQERETRQQLAKLAGVSHDTIAKAKLVIEHADEETKQQLRKSKDKSLNRVAKDVKEKLQRDKRETDREKAITSKPMIPGIIVGDFRKCADRVADGSLSLIFTDPPYNREATKMLPDLGKFAASKLADGGSLILYVGQTQLPEALDALRGHLRYWWTIACVHAGRSTVMREYGINAHWKAVLWFVKKTRNDNSVMVNDVMSGGEEKTHHDWQQAVSEAEYWIKHLCPGSGLVCDPYLGSGTTAVAARNLKRKWIGFEIDEKTANVASERIEHEDK